MEVPRSDRYVMSCIKVFSEIIGQVFLARVPLNLKIAAVGLIRNPDETHFHGARALFLGGVVGNACCRLIVTMCRHGRLGMSKFLEYEL